MSDSPPAATAATQESGSSVPSGNSNPTNNSSAKPSANNSPSPSPSSTELSPNIKLMTEGSTFDSFLGTGEDASKKPVLVFYDPSGGKLGSFYWNENLKREKVDGQSLPLHTITDVFLGYTHLFFSTKSHTHISHAYHTPHAYPHNHTAQKETQHKSYSQPHTDGPTTTSSSSSIDH